MTQCLAFFATTRRNLTRNVTRARAEHSRAHRADGSDLAELGHEQASHRYAVSIRERRVRVRLHTTRRWGHGAPGSGMHAPPSTDWFIDCVRADVHVYVLSRKYIYI